MKSVLVNPLLPSENEKETLRGSRLEAKFTIVATQEIERE